MSFSLPALDTTGFTTATTGMIDLGNVGVSAGGISASPSLIDNPAYIYFFNDSGVGFQMRFLQSGKGFDLPAGAWLPVSILPGNTQIGYSVLYTLNNPPVNKLMMTYYAPGEPIPRAVNLGNSPIGGSLLPVQATTLSNEGNALGITVIDIGTTTIANLWQVFNDHFLIYVQQGGVRHQVLAGNIAGSPPLQIGAPGDTVEFLGNPTVDQALTVTGNTVLNSLTTINANLSINGTLSADTGKITTDGSGDMTFPNNQSIQWKNALGTAKIAMFVNTLDHLILQQNDAAGQILFRDVNNNIIATIGAGSNFIINLGDLNLNNKKINDNAGHNWFDGTGTGIFVKGNTTTAGPFNFQGNGAQTDWIMGSLATGGGTTANGAVAITHGLKQLNVAATPTAVIITPTQSPSLFWITSIGPTTFTINATSVWTFNFVVFRNAL